MADRPGDLGSRGPRAADRPPSPVDEARSSSASSSALRITGIVLGFALAIAATLAVFLTDNALYLRLAVIAVAWAFVIAAFSAGRRKTDQAVAAGRENELRRAYELELEREVAARREYELRLENQLRRETQEAMRAEMDQLRSDLAGLAALRDQLSGLGELRSDMSRLRHELTEQLSGEMLVERIVMRTQSIRMPNDRPRLDRGDDRLLEGSPAWEEPTRPPEETPAERSTLPPVPPLRPVEATQAIPRVADDLAQPTDAAPVEPVRTPEPEPVRAPEPEPEPVPAYEPERPSAALWQTPATDQPRHHRRAPEEEVVVAPAEPEHEPDVYETAGHQRLTQILAESGSTAGGSRRRRRYRDDDEADGDDVLARVLNQR